MLGSPNDYKRIDMEMRVYTNDGIFYSMEVGLRHTSVVAERNEISNNCIRMSPFDVNTDVHWIF
jgi:hypothetical protein